MITELIQFCFLRNMKLDVEFSLVLLLPTWQAIWHIAQQPTASPWTNPFSTLLPGTTRVFAASCASKVLCCLSAKILAQSNQAPPPGLAPAPFSSLAPQALTDPAQGPLGLVTQTQHTWYFCVLSLLFGRAVQRTHSVRSTSNAASHPKPLGLFLSLVPPPSGNYRGVSIFP